MKKFSAMFLSVLGVLIASVIFSGCGKKVETTKAPSPKPKLTIPANQIPVSERPFVMLEPTAAREVKMTVYSLVKPAEELDYELQYSAGDKEEAAIGSVMLKSAKAPYVKTVLLGSKSGGGKITYHENVTGGTLVMSFYDENYKLSNEWSYIDNKKALTSFFSRDGKFTIETAKLLKGVPYVIVYQNPGVPAEVKKTILAGPYSITGTSTLPTGKVSVSLRLSEAKPAEIWGWDGKAWKPFPTKVTEKMATAQVDLMSTYVAVEK